MPTLSSTIQITRRNTNSTVTSSAPTGVYFWFEQSRYDRGGNKYAWEVCPARLPAGCRDTSRAASRAGGTSPDRLLAWQLGPEWRPAASRAALHEMGFQEYRRYHQSRPECCSPEGGEA